MPTRTQAPLPCPCVSILGLKKLATGQRKGKNNTVSSVINSQHLPLQQDPRSSRLARTHTHTHTHSALLGNNVGVNFKWIARWISLSRVKKKKQNKRQQKGNNQYYRKRMFAPPGCFPGNLEPFQVISKPGQYDAISFRVVILAFSSYIMNILFVTYFFVERSTGRWLPRVYFRNGDNSAELIWPGQLVLCTFTQLIIFKPLIIYCFLFLYFKPMAELGHVFFPVLGKNCL